MSILIAVIVFGLVVLVHELGHFLVARRCGVWVEEFAIGMGPKLIGIQGKDTLYTIRAIPLGGFCKLHDDTADVTGDKPQKDGQSAEAASSAKESAASAQSAEESAAKAYVFDPERSFNNKSIPKRMAIMLAGSGFNFILSLLIFFGIVAALGYNNTTVWQFLVPDMPAEQAGLLPGDRIYSINGQRTRLFEDISFELFLADGSPMDIEFIRDGTRHNIQITPAAQEQPGGGYAYRLGFSPHRMGGMFETVPDGYRTTNIGQAAYVAFFRVGFHIRANLQTLGRLITGRGDLDQIAGPIGIVGAIDDQYQAAVELAAVEEVPAGRVVLGFFLNMLNFTAWLSAALAIFNLLPFPALDGGRLVFLGLEAVRRKPIPPEKEGIFHLVGFAAFILLAIFVAYRDILRLLP